MKMTLRALTALTILCSASAKADDCGPTPRVSDGEAKRIAADELTKRSPKFDSSAFTYSVVDNRCDIHVVIVKKSKEGLGGTSTLVLDRSGKVKYYFGSM
jgi:hypothetical protein